jgi:crossover junction endodeoxyribonuclease RusA
VIELVLSFPPKDLEPNARPNRYAKAVAIKTYRYGCSIQALSQVRQLAVIPSLPLKPPVKAEITFVVRNLQRDADNLLASFKAGIDGLRDAHVIGSDSSRYFDPGRPIVLQGEREEVRVVLRGAE